MKKITTTIFAVIFISLLSCSEMTGEFEFMNELKTSISGKYETSEIEIKMENRELIVILKESDFSHLNVAEKEQISREIGKLVNEIRGKKEKTGSGVVKFREEGDYGIAKTSSTETYQMYE